MTKTKTIKGWLTIANDHKFGPTLLLYNKKGQPRKMPFTDFDCLKDDSWDSVHEIFDIIQGEATRIEMVINIKDKVELEPHKK